MCEKQKIFDEIIAHFQTLLVMPAMRQLYVDENLGLYAGIDSTNMESAIELIYRLKKLDVHDHASDSTNIAP